DELSPGALVGRVEAQAAEQAGAGLADGPAVHGFTPELTRIPRFIIAAPDGAGKPFSAGKRPGWQKRKKSIGRYQAKIKNYKHSPTLIEAEVFFFALACRMSLWRCIASR